MNGFAFDLNRDPPQHPAISVICINKNHGDYIEDTLVSVMAQKFDDFELIVADGGSTDQSLEILGKYRFVRLVSGKDSSRGEGLARALGQARGRYVMVTTSTDGYLSRDWFAAAASVLDREPQVALVCGASAAMSGTGSLGAVSWPRNYAFDAVPAKEKWPGIWLVEGFGASYFPELNYCVRIDIFRRLFGPSEDFPELNGIDPILRFHFEFNRLGFLPQYLPILANFGRTHDHQEQLSAHYKTDLSRYGTAWRRYSEAVLGGQLIHQIRGGDGQPFAQLAINRVGAPAPSGTPAMVAPTPAPAVMEPAAPRADRPELPSAPADPEASMRALRAAGLWREGSTLRLHLGCGERRAEGYINVDLAPSGPSLMQSQADIYGDVAQLRFPPAAVDEIRSHHMFEHFPRVEALALLIRWHEWLRLGGRLVIETPDIEGSARTLVSDQPLSIKMAVVRHLAGDQAEPWAFHVDHWFADRLRDTLERLGFGSVLIERQSWPQPPYLSNVIALGVKEQALSREQLLASADELLGQSLVAPSEAALLARWREQLRALLAGAAGIRTAAASGTGTPVGHLDPAGWIAKHGDRAPLAEIVNFNQLQRDRWVARLATSVPPGARVLDIGAGTCPYRERFSHCQYQTHDFKRYEGEKLGGTTAYGRIDFVSDIAAIPAPDSSFDVILCTEVLEHVPQPFEAVREMARLLKPGGRLLLSAPLGSGRHQMPYHFYGGFTPEWYQHTARLLDLQVVSITPNGGFFRLMAQEAARAGTILAQAGNTGAPREVLALLGEHLPRWFTALDDSHFHDQFTVGYFVEARRVPTA